MIDAFFIQHFADPGDRRKVTRHGFACGPCVLDVVRDWGADQLRDDELRIGKATVHISDDPTPCSVCGAVLAEGIRMPGDADPVSSTDIATRLGVTLDTVDKWRRRHADFPAPRWHAGSRPLWAWTNVAAWAQSTGRM